MKVVAVVVIEAARVRYRAIEIKIDVDVEPLILLPEIIFILNYSSFSYFMDKLYVLLHNLSIQL